MLDGRAIDRVVEQEMQQLQKPATKIVTLSRRFRRKMQDVKLDDVQEIFQLCEDIDADPANAIEEPVLRQATGKLRYRILLNLLEEYYKDEISNVPEYGVETARSIRSEQRIAESVAHMLPLLQQDAPEEFNQHWLLSHCTREVALIEDLLRDSHTGVESWQSIKDMLPKSLQDRFKPDTQLAQSARMVDILNQYRHIAELHGPETVAQYLVSSGIIRQGGFEGAMKIITPYLGRCAVKDPAFIDTVQMPETLLRCQDLDKLFFLQLRNSTYRRLAKRYNETISSGGYVDTAWYREQSALLRIEADEAVANEQRQRPETPLETQRALLDSVVRYFEEIGETVTPERLLPYLEYDGRKHPFPSLRQLMAMKETAEKRRLLVSFFMGGGKTETVFLSKEHVGAKKLLFVCLPNMTHEVAGRVHPAYAPEGRSSCYKPGQEPSVGIIEAGIKPEGLRKALEAEVVIVPYSMLHISIGGKKVIDHLVDYRAADASTFDFLAVDEVHNARKGGGAYTEGVYTLATEIPDLYEKGYITLLSGEPIPNKPDDIVPQLRIYDRETYGDITSLRSSVRQTHPLVVRNALLDFLLLIDEPENWERFTRIVEYELHPEERMLYDGIRDDESFSFTEKIRHLLLATINPSLLSHGQNIRSSLFDQTLELTRDYLSSHRSVLIAENALKQGVSRPHRSLGTGLTATFCQRLQSELEREYGTAVRLFIIDGDSPSGALDAAIDASQRSESDPSEPMTVIFAMSGCVREGINLSHMHRAILLEPTFNKPDTAQFVKRFNREGNDDVEIALLRARGTLHEGIAEHADWKYNVTHAMKHGGTFTNNDLAIFDAEMAKDSMGLDQK